MSTTYNTKNVQHNKLTKKLLDLRQCAMFYVPTFYLRAFAFLK